MREEQRLGEARLAASDGGIHRDAGKTVKRRLLRGVEGERHQRRARRDDAKAELPGDVVSQAGGADLRDR